MFFSKATQKRKRDSEDSPDAKLQGQFGNASKNAHATNPISSYCSARGKVVKVQKEFGFIAVQGADNDVFFHLSKVACSGQLPLCRGDIVDVEYFKSLKGLHAKSVTVVCLHSRTTESLLIFLDAVTLDEQTMLSLCNSPPFWELMMKSKEISESAANLLCSLFKKSDSGKLSTSIAPLLDMCFPLILNTTDPENLQHFLRMSGKHRPHQLARLVPRARRLLPAGAHTQNLIWDVLSSASLACARGEVRNLSWQQQPLLPTPGELQSLDPATDVPTLKRQGGYESTEDLLEHVFALEREDCMYPLRQGIQSILRGDVDSPDCTLFSARLVGVVVREQGILPVFEVQNRTQRRRSKHLMHGGLLCFALNGSFSSPVMATVVQHTGNRVAVELCERDDMNISHLLVSMRSNGWIAAVESPVYFRAHEPVMKQLQAMEVLPFEDELLRCISPPELSARAQMLTPSISAVKAFQLMGVNLGRNRQDCEENVVEPAADLETLLCYLRNSTAVHVDGVLLDPTQQAAVLHALEHRVAIIQGPPGTGKSMIGILLVKLLLALGIERILVVSYKNHILNEILLELLRHQAKLVRIGHTQADSALEPHNIRNQVKRIACKEQWTRISQNKAKQKVVQEALETEVANLSKALCFDFGDTSAQFMGPGQVEELLSGTKWNHREKKELNNLLQRLPDDCGVAAFITKDASKDIDQSLRDLQWEIKAFLRRAAQVWFPSSAFEQLSKVENHRLVLDPFLQTRKASESGSAMEMDTDSGEVEVEETEEELLEFNRRSATQSSSQIDFAKDVITFRSGVAERGQVDPEGNPAVLDRLGEADVALLLGEPQVWEMSQHNKALLVYACLARQQAAVNERIRNLTSEMVSIHQEHQREEEALRLSVLRANNVVGMTLDGQAIHADLMSRWEPQVVMVEECAECPFAKVLALCYPFVQHLIQIGDTKQLPPLINSHHLVKHNWSMSMAEWLVNSGLPHVSLGRQGRMPPFFRELMQDIYPELGDNQEVVQLLEPVDCIARSAFWWTHSFAEKSVGTSFVNHGEALMLARLACYLVSQGNSPSSITIIAAYGGQVREIQRLLADEQGRFEHQLPELSEPIEVCTIDEKQGGENDFVLVSLVRTGKLRGFLARRQGKQRRCVAQSRARKGLYFAADHRTFRQDPSWAFLLQKLEESGCLGEALPLMCARHPEVQNRRLVHRADAMPITQSVCGLRCGQSMECNEPAHICTRPCHGGTGAHSRKRCCHIVQFLCPFRHVQTRRCKDPVSECSHQVEFSCSANHRLVRKCCEEEANIRCKVTVTVSCESGHPLEAKCWEKESQDSRFIPACEEKCSRKLPCDHLCPRKCKEVCLPVEQCRICKTLRQEEQNRARKAARLEYLQEIAHLVAELQTMRSRDIPVVSSKLELLQTSETAQEYFEIHDKVVKYIRPHHNWYPVISKIEKVFNPEQRRKFCEVAKDLQDPTNKALKFHGCDANAAASIMDEGFRLPSHNRNMYGKGVYFASDSSKSAQDIYTKGSNMLLVCEVLLGKPWTVSSAMGMEEMDRDKVWRKGFDSVFAPRGSKQTGGVENDEFVVYDPRQAMVKYVVHFHSVELQNAPCLLPGGENALSIVRHTLKPKREFNLHDSHDMHFRIVESQFLRLENASRGMLTSLEYVLNPSLIAKFNCTRDAFARQGHDHEILAFHATRTPENIENIVRNNFNQSFIGSATDSGWWGRGFYFSEFPSVSLGYGGNLLLCRLLPGKTFDCQERMDGQPLTRGFDSHRVQADAKGRAQELVIANPDQILPCYILHLSELARR